MNWKEFQKCSEQIARQIDFKEIDCIVAITRGGLFLAGILSEISGIKEIYTIGYESYHKRKRGKIKEVVPIHSNVYNKRVLLVDDIIDSGKTLLLTKQILTMRKNIVKTAVIYKSKEAKLSPDFYGKISEEWIQFPWEYEEA